MTTKLPLLVFLFASLVSSSQIIWTGGGGDINWNTANNWSSTTIPTAMDNVEIPAGFTVTIMGVASCQSLELKGSAILNIDGGSFFSNQPSFFETGTTVNWASGSIDCPLLVNQGTMNLTSGGDKSFVSSSIVNNNGTINISGSGDLFLQDNTVLNNEFDGIIDMGADDGDIDNLAGLSILNNEGLIRRSTSSGEARIETIEFNNNGGIIQVDSGTLGITGFGDKNFTGGSYVVSAGTVLDWDTAITVSGFLMGTVEGDLNWSSTIEVPVSATFNFTGGGNFNWTSGNLEGGGILTNESTINLTGTPNKPIQDNTTLNNNGTLNIIGSGDLSIQSDSVLNNSASGIIDMQTNGGNIMQSVGVGTLNNSGFIQRTSSTGDAQISCTFNNNNGTIQVESGTLTLITNDKSLTDGIYNVFAGAVMDWDTDMTLFGVLSGTVDGELNWNDILDVPVSTTLNFSGSGTINWMVGSLDGGGVLTNQSTINLTTTGAKIIQGDTTFNNAGIINITSGGDVLINQGIINNQASGIIDMQFNEGNITRSAGTSNVLNNSGLIRRTTTTGTARILIELNNSGTIDVQSGILDIGNNSFPFFNLINGVIKGVGEVELPLTSNYTNDGTFAPGASPGTLNVDGDYESTANAVLDIELDGLAQGTQYDLLAITGNADFNGALQVTLNFDADINDEFIIATTTGTINSCNLPAMVSADFGGFTYDFSVTCRNNNELVLSVTNETLSTGGFELNPIAVYPNPTRGYVFVNSSEISKITLYDINGREILETRSSELDIQYLKNGIYLLEITDPNGKQVIKKIVKY
ncbi:T9SS type A sorting domain-containing protein [Winogradskyella sp.]|uniref:T9SS type A sorting domain-containing protein n=1 Tax=Winogradskyella sp. TaxID=1883156 RepID=UPI003BAB3086